MTLITTFLTGIYVLSEYLYCRQPMTMRDTEARRRPPLQLPLRTSRWQYLFIKPDGELSPKKVQTHDKINIFVYFNDVNCRKKASII